MSRSKTARALGASVIIALGLVTACSDSGNDNDSDGDSDNVISDSTPPATIEWPPSDVTIGPLVSGTSAIVDGTISWTDYVYDDRGPNTDDGDRTDMASAGGDAAYPGDLSNAADFVQVQLRRDKGALAIRVVLQTLLDPGIPLVGIAFDTDNKPSTGAAKLPGLWQPKGALGMDVLVVMARGAGEVLAWDDGQWHKTADINVSVNPEKNTLDATLPNDFDVPADAVWNVIGVAGTTADSWLSGTGTIHDLAFVSDEPAYQWQDYRQADILSGKAAVDAAIARIDFGRLADGLTQLPDATAPGFHTYLYRSDLKLAEGINEAAAGPEFLGPYQPYLVYVPEPGHQDAGAMTVFLHGLTQNHLSSVLLGDTYLGTGRPLSEEIGGLAEYVRDGTDFPPHNLTVWPLARGAALYYQGIAEQDVLDVLDDALLRLGPDPDRIILSGASMGGIGTFRLGALYPDLWSVAVPIIGYAQPAVEPLLGNFENLEILQINGAMDTLIPRELAQGTTDLLDALDLRFHAWMLDRRGHEAGGYVYDCIYRDLADYKRAVNPARVRYTVDPQNFLSDPDTGIELVQDRAYWVSGIKVANESSLGRVDARSLALPSREPEQIVRTDERYDGAGAARDLCDPNPDITTGDTWRFRALERTRGEQQPVENRLEVVLTNLAEATFDLAAAGIDTAAASVLHINTDSPAGITLTGLESDQSVRIAGATITANAEGRVRIPVPAGQSTISIAAI